MENEQELISKKARVLFDNRLPVHINMKDGAWYNGEIVEPFTADFFMLMENKLGLMPIFFLQVRDIDKLEVKNE
jgi:hypothetical protein